jgi:hypothetical protein
VFDPTRLRIDLAELALHHRDDAPAGMEHDRTRARGALVERKQVFLAHDGVSESRLFSKHKQARRVSRQEL